MLIPLFLNLNHRTTSFLEKLKRVDWVGSVLFVASMMSLLIPITWGGVMYPWDHWRTLVPLVLGVVGLVGFVLYEKFVAKEPLIRLGVFSTRTALVNYVGTVMHGMIVSLELDGSQWLVGGLLIIFYHSFGVYYIISHYTSKLSKVSVQSWPV